MLIKFNNLLKILFIKFFTLPLQKKSSLILFKDIKIAVRRFVRLFTKSGHRHFAKVIGCKDTAFFIIQKVL